MRIEKNSKPLEFIILVQAKEFWGVSKEGDIVVALVDNQNTLKRYFRDDENKKIILHPENKKMKDIIVDECCIQGVACHIIKEL